MAYFDKYGVEFTDDRKTIVHCPANFEGMYIIPNGVTSIGSGAFKDCIGLTSIFIPNSVTEIEDEAFVNCISLRAPIYNEHVFAYMPTSYFGRYTIPQGIKVIAGTAFVGCTGLTSISIPNSVKSIGNAAFVACDGLTSPVYNEHVFAYMPTSYSGKYTIPQGIKAIAGGAFGYCNGLTSVTIPNSVKSIGDEAFEGCSNLTTIAIPDSVTSIGENAFHECFSLTSINIPNSVTSIGNRAFYECRSVESVTIPDSIVSIGDEAFYRCESLKELTIGNKVITIGKGAFQNCSALTSIVIPDSVTSIAENAFMACVTLKSVTIGNSVISIGDSAFHGCRDLTSITIGNNVSKMGDGVFAVCDNLTEIFVPIGQENRFRKMEGLQRLADIIHSTSAKQKLINRRENYEQFLIQEQQLAEMLQGSILFFDTETTGTPRNYKAPVTDSNNWPRLVQLAWIMVDKEGRVLKKDSVIVKPDGFNISADAASVHGITTERANREGKLLQEVLEEFATDLSFAERVVGHNVDFDQHIVGAELCRMGMDYEALMNKPSICTMKASTDFCAIPNPNPYFGGYKWPSLQELYRKLFGHDFSGVHDALADVTATKECYFELKRRGIIQ